MQENSTCESVQLKVSLVDAAYKLRSPTQPAALQLPPSGQYAASRPILALCPLTRSAQRLCS
jgi:hypothetical protein